MLLELIFIALLNNIPDGRTDAQTRSPLLGLLSEPKSVVISDLAMNLELENIAMSV